MAQYDNIIYRPTQKYNKKTKISPKIKIWRNDFQNLCVSETFEIFVNFYILAISAKWP